MTGRLHAQEPELPHMVEVPLREFLENGVLMAVNERVLWPIGLALRVNVGDDGDVEDLAVVRWAYPDGHREIIESADDDIAQERRRRFDAYVRTIAAMMPIEGEAEVALGILPDD